MKKNLNAKERAYVERARVCHVGSIGADGHPHTAPVSPVAPPNAVTSKFS